VQTDHLFAVSALDVTPTGDDWYTPRWLFDAAGIAFDLDVAAPIDPAMRTCPARPYLTPVEDGLTAPWHGVVWCNPPYSGPAPWIQRFAAHAEGMALVPAARSRWLGTLMAAADAVALISCVFGRPDGRSASPGGMALVLAARGRTCAAAVARVAAADVIAAGAYHVRDARSAGP
jgi:DNA N-6-adenine-methyltransferase (Dam)